MILHLLKNDCRHLRLWLFAWLGVLLGIFLMIAALRTPLGWSQGYWEFLRFGFLGAFLIQMLVQALLVFKVVQKENLQSPKSYWLTRPIERGHLVAAKLLFWSLLIFLPQLVQCALLGAIFPGGWEGALDGTEDVLLAVSVIGFCSFLAASATKDVAQAFLLVFAVPFALLLSGHFLVKVAGRVMPVERMVDPLATIVYLESVVLVTALLAGFFVYWRMVHLPAKRWRYRLSLFVVFSLLMIAGKLPTVEQVPESTMRPPEGAALELSRFMFTRTDYGLGGSRSGHVDFSIQLWQDKPNGSDYGIKAHTLWKGLPETWIAHAEPVRSYDADGRWLRGPKRNWHKWDGERMFYADYLRSLFPDAEVAREVAYGGTGKQLFSSPAVPVESLEPPLEFTTVFATDFYRPQMTRLFLSPGAMIDLMGTRLRLVRMEREGEDMIAEFVFLSVKPRLGDVSGNLEDGYLILRDPISKFVALGRSHSRSSTNVFGILSIGQIEFRFKGISATGTEQPRLELYHLRQNLVGTSVEPIRYTVPAEN